MKRFLTLFLPFVLSSMLFAQTSGKKNLEDERSPDLNLFQDDIIVLPEDQEHLVKDGSGAHLFVKKRGDIESLLLLVDSDNYNDPDLFLMRAKEPNSVNENEIRYAYGSKSTFRMERLPNALMTSTVEETVFGDCFHIYIPNQMYYGYVIKVQDECEFEDGMKVSVRSFARKYCDVGGAFKDNRLFLNLSDWQIEESFAEKRRLDSELDEIENYLSIDINEDDLNQIYRKILKLKKEEAELSVDLESLNQKRSTANGTLIKATSEFNKKVTAYLNRVEANDDADRSLKYMEMAIQVLDRYSIRLQEKKTDALANTITICYKKLANKKNLIERIAMDPVTLDLSYLDKNDNEVDKASLSAGEEQLMVISILWALAICSKKKLPVIIDTPLSRLDSNHRKSLIQVYFPKASDQTIILSTDSEIDEKYYKLMKHDVGDEFTLDYSDETKSTSIKKGYFLGGEE